MTRFMFSLAAVVSIAGSASAGVAPGDIVFTSQQGNSINLLSGGSVTQLYVNPNPSARMASIVLGPNGNFFVTDGRLPGNPAAGILEVSNLFTGASVSTFTDGPLLTNPVGMAYDAPTNQFIVVNNPSGQGFPNPDDGVVGVPFNSPGAASTLFSEPNPAGPNPRYEGGVYTIPNGQGGYYITSINGGVDQGTGSDTQASTLWSLNPDGGGGFSMSSSPVIDFSQSEFGGAFSYTSIRGITEANGSLFVTDTDAGQILRLDLDGSGALSGFAVIASGLDQPESIIFNPFTGELVFSERGGLTDSKISSINPDGTGYEILLEGEHARGFYIVPTPGTGALLLLSGLAAVRRRR